MNILFVTEISPFPVNKGEKLRSYGLLKILSTLNHKVTAVIGTSGNERYKEYHLPNIDFIEFDYKKTRSKSKYINYWRLFRMNHDLKSLVAELIKNKNIDVVHLDYNYLGQYIDFIKSKGIPVIYGTHNAQSSLIIQRPPVSFKNSISVKLSHKIHHLHETKYFNRAGALIVVSEEDKRFHKGFVNEQKIYVIPNFLLEDEYRIDIKEKSNHIIMTANFNAYQNYIGLKWFIENVWDEELSDKTELHLVGLGSIEVYTKLKPEYTLKNIKAIGEVDDLKPYISQAKASIVPLLHGSGSRLKCIESMALKTQLVSTSKGAEGIVHKGSILIADTKEQFKSYLIRILENKIDHTVDAYKEFLDNYSSNPNAEIYEQILTCICTS